MKAFNHVYAELLERGAVFGDQRASVFLCGSDEKARAEVCRIVDELGFSPVDLGDLENARYLEPAAALIVELVRGRGFDAENAALHLLTRGNPAKEDGP